MRWRHAHLAIAEYSAINASEDTVHHLVRCRRVNRLLALVLEDAIELRRRVACIYDAEGYKEQPRSDSLP